MPISAVKLDASAVDVRLSNEHVLVVLADGRELAAPLAWFPRPCRSDGRAAPKLAPDRARTWHPLA
jgi:hypothetical protein